MKKRLLFFGCVLLSVAMLSLYAQKKSTTSQFKTKYAEALRLYDLEEPTEQTDRTALQNFLQASGDAALAGDYTTAVDCFIKAGNIHQTYQRFDSSFWLYHRAISLNSSKLKSKKSEYEAYLYIGSSFYFNNIIDSAQHYLEKASTIAYSQVGGMLPERDRLYNSLGAIYFESANYLQAKNYFERSLQVISPSTDPDYMDLLIGNKSNIANCLLRLGQYDSALSIYQILNTYSLQKDIDAVIKQNTAHAYFELGKYDTAISIYKKINYSSRLHRIKAFNDLGRIYMRKAQWQQAEAIFDSVILNSSQVSAAIKNKDEALAYLYRGQLADSQGLVDEALVWCNEALQEVHLNFKSKQNGDVPEDISQTISHITLFEVLHTKARLHMKKYKLTGKEEHIVASIAAYRKAIETANFIKQNFDNDEAKLFFNRNNRVIYAEAVEAAYEVSTAVSKKYIDDYIFIQENYKGSVLYQNLQNVQLKSAAKLPDSIKQKEKELKQLLAFYTSRINSNTIEKDASALQSRLLELQVDLSRLQKKYAEDETYNLFKAQASAKAITFSDIQSKADNNTAYISYFTTDSIIYILAVSKSDVQLTKVKADSSYARDLEEFFREVYNHNEGQRYNGTAASFALYNKLIEPVASVTDKCSNWVIIPDGIIYYLPIETFVSSNDDKEYVVQTKTVSYHYSFALLFQKNTHHTAKESNKKNIVGFAPFAINDKVIAGGILPELPFSKNEIADTAMKSFLGYEATKERFLKEATNYSVIHMATHASTADSVSNWIQFYPAESAVMNQKLFVHEIYNLDLSNTELVILSACETGGGISTSGDGLLSLSRAFMYAGSDGIISTLWKTEDQVTAYLMQQLHKYLKQSITPARALQLAKIDLLQNKEMGSQYKTPNYWGNFIYAGKVKHTSSSTVFSKWWLLFLPLVAGGVYLFYRYKKRNIRHQTG